MGLNESELTPSEATATSSLGFESQSSSGPESGGKLFDVAASNATDNVRGEGTSMSLFGLCDAAADPKPPKLIVAGSFSNVQAKCSSRRLDSQFPTGTLIGRVFGRVRVVSFC